MPHVTARLDCSICLLLEDDAASWDWVVLVGCGRFGSPVNNDLRNRYTFY
jgi:hypothetical protein